MDSIDIIHHTVLLRCFRCVIGTLSLGTVFIWQNERPAAINTVYRQNVLPGRVCRLASSYVWTALMSSSLDQHRSHSTLTTAPPSRTWAEDISPICSVAIRYTKRTLLGAAQVKRHWPRKSWPLWTFADHCQIRGTGSVLWPIIPPSPVPLSHKILLCSPWAFG